MHEAGQSMLLLWENSVGRVSGVGGKGFSLGVYMYTHG